MNPPEGERKIILVVKDRELFTVLLSTFSCDYFEVLFTEGPDALSLGSLRNLRLVTIPFDSEEGIDLAGALKEASREISVLGITLRPLESLGTTPECVDQVVARSNRKEVTSAARGLLGERRKRPRVMVDFPVTLGAGIGIVKDLSATSLLVETENLFDGGDWVQVEIGEGDHPFQFEAQVGRMHRSALGTDSVVLQVSEDTPEAREYLEQLVWKLMEVQYYLNGSSPRPGVLRGPMSWEMAQRVERNLRDSEELTPISSNQIAKEPFKDQLESRYRLGKHLGRWGVGEVYSASHQQLKRPLVIKILREDLKGSETARKRMESEALIPSNMSCPSIVDVVDFGSDGQGGLFYAMEALPGELLASAVERGQQYSARDLARLGVHLATALAIAHLRGYGHFDICPQNVYLQRWSEGPAWPVLINMAGCPSGGALMDNHPVGQDFWPPEPHDELPGPRHDIYGLGALLEHLCRHAAAGDDAQGFDLLSKCNARATTLETGDRYPDMNVMAHTLVQCWEALEATAPVEELPQVETPRELKKVFEQSASAAKTLSNQFIAEAMAAFASVDPRLEEPPAYTEIEIEETPARSRPKASPKDDVMGIEAGATSPGAGQKTAAVGNLATVSPVRRRVPSVLLMLGVLAIGTGLWMQMKSKEAPPVVQEATAPAVVPRGPSAGPAEARREEQRPVAIRPSISQPRVSSDPDVVPQPRPDIAATITVPAVPDARLVTDATVKPGPDTAKGGKQERLAAIKEARALIKGGRYAAARQHLKTALGIQDSTAVRSLLSQTCEKAGLYQEAIDHLKKVAAQKPDVAWYQDKLGRLYLKVGKTTLACQAFKRALKILPTYPAAKGNFKKHCR